jgi:hypothetical protein
MWTFITSRGFEFNTTWTSALNYTHCHSSDIAKYAHLVLNIAINIMEDFYKTHRRATYRFKISTQAQAGGYPSSLNCHVTHHVWIPKGKRLDSRRIIGPLTGEVELNVFFKLGRKSLEPEAFIKSSLFAEIINSLNTVFVFFF